MRKPVLENKFLATVVLFLLIGIVAKESWSLLQKYKQIISIKIISIDVFGLLRAQGGGNLVNKKDLWISSCRRWPWAGPLNQKLGW